MSLLTKHGLDAWGKPIPGSEADRARKIVARKAEKNVDKAMRAWAAKKKAGAPPMKDTGSSDVGVMLGPEPSRSNVGPDNEKTITSVTEIRDNTVTDVTKKARGRPKSGNALSPAEKQKAYRERQKGK